MEESYLPFLKALRAFGVQFFDGDNHAKAWFGRGEGLLIQPTLVDSAKATFTQQCVPFETLGGGFQVHETELLQVGPFQNLAVRGTKWKRTFAVDAPTGHLRELALPEAAGGGGEPHVTG